MLRLITAVVLAPLLWFFIREAPPIAFEALAVVAVAVACWECYVMLEAKGARPFKWLGIAAGAAIGWSFIDVAPLYETAMPLSALAILTIVTAMWRRGDPAEMLDTSMCTVFPVLLVGLGLSYLIGLRGMPGEDGQDLLLLLFFCVILADTTAFYVGTAIGRHRMAPRLSPKKSWEGAVGGMTASVGGALVAHFWFYQRLGIGHAIVLGLIIGAASILGDLAESVIKRAAGVKDSSGLLPGHGGLLDRTDSLLLSAPILYYYYRFFL